MENIEFTIIEITDYGQIIGDTEAGIVHFKYEDLFDFGVGTEITRNKKTWVVVKEGLLSVHCELKKDTKYKKGFLKAELIKNKYNTGDKLIWYAPQILLSEKVA